jgi:hypothetical protein
MKVKSTLLPILLLLGAIALLVPGVTQPMLSISGTMDKAQLKNAGIDILADSFVDEEADEQAQQASRQRVTGMINSVAAMMGMNEVSGEIEAYQKTRSIIGTVTDLYKSGDILVALLVMLFSIVIPTLKILMSLTAQLLRSGALRNNLMTINGLLSKWSMADVFVVALIVTFMAANASGAGGLLTFHSQFESGFYFFLGYCVFSITAAQLIEFMDTKSSTVALNSQQQLA